VSPYFHIVEWAVRWIIVAAAIGFPFAMAFSWFYEWTPHGIQRESDVETNASVTRETGKKMDRWIIAILGVAVVLLLADKFVLHSDAGVATVIDKSVAVLPLLNESGDPQQDYFSDGLSEELISALAQVHDLKIIGRNSSFQFRGRQQDDTAAIGAKLGVATLLEGTVRKQGNRVRIVASLVKASDGSELWSQTYDRELKDVFAVQSEIATSVAGALKTTLLGRTIESADKPPSGNLDAYNALLQGRFYAERRNRVDYLKAVDYYQQAIRLDPDYAIAYARLAIAQQWFNNWVANADERKAISPLARSNANKAVELNPQSAVALGALGINQAWSDIDYPAAEATLKKAVALDPSNPETLYQLADVTGCLGRLDESVAMMRKVLAMEPLNASFHFYTGQFLLAMGRLDEAEAELRRAIELQPTAEAFRTYLAMAYIKHGQLDQALLAANAEPGPAQHRAALAMVYFAQGDKARGEAQLAEIIRLDATYSQMLIADIYVLRGDADQVFEWLDRGLAKGDPGVAAMYEDPFLVPALRQDPRLALVARRLGLPDPATVPARGPSPPVAPRAVEPPATVSGATP
ncbi:MAG TPA: tetratricopeptide repeat protein, partial [Rudaea sp.]|nr:tetratricopeptide repeat protein [Rudaea sp.]